MSIRLVSTLGSALLFALACTGGETETPPAPPAPPAAVAPPPVAPAAPAATGEVGVAECDEYIKQMTACLGSMDPAVKAATESSFKMTTDAWRAAAATPEGKAGLAVGCKAALDAIPPTCKPGGAPPAGGGAGGPPAGGPGGPGGGPGGPGAGGPGAGKTPPAGAAAAEKVEVKVEEKKAEPATNPDHVQGKGMKRKH